MKKRIVYFICAAALVVAASGVAIGLAVRKSQTFLVFFDVGASLDILQPQTVKYAKLVQMPRTPYLENHSFVGWYKDPLCTVLYDFDTKVKADMVLYADYIRTYLVEFDTRCDYFIAPERQRQGQPVEKPADPVRDGFDFEGWFIDEACAERYNFNLPLTGDIKLYAGWKRVYFILNFDTIGGEPLPRQQVSVGQKPICPQEVYKQNARLVDWYMDSDYRFRFDFDIPLTDDLTIYALWEDLPEGNNVLTLLYPYPKVYQRQAVASGQLATVPPDPPPKENEYRFGGWYTGLDFDEAFNFTLPLAGDTLVFGKTEYLRSVSFFDGQLVHSRWVFDGNYAGEPPLTLPKRDGEEFVGWFLDTKKTVPYDPYAVVFDNIVVYAEWRQIICSVTFLNFDGSVFGGGLVAWGHTVEPLELHKIGYEFLGWYSDSACAMPFDFSQGIVSDTIIYPKFAKSCAVFLVTFCDFDGSILARSLVEAGEKVTPPQPLKRDNYKFEGWSQQELLDCVTQNITSYAMYSHNNSDSNGFLYAQHPHLDGLLVSGILTDKAEIYLPTFHDGKRVLGTLDLQTSLLHGKNIALVFVPEGYEKIGANSLCSPLFGKSKIMQPKPQIVFDGRSNLREVGSYAFAGTAFSDLVLFEGEAGTIGARAFAHITAESIALGDGLAALGENAFEGAAIGHMVYGANIDIPQNAFLAAQIGSIDLSGEFAAVGDYAFFECDILGGIALPQSVKSVGRSAFEGCSAVALTLPDGLAFVGEWAFSRMVNLTEITLPAAITELSASIFLDCIALSIVNFEGAVQRLGADAFRNTAIETIDLPAQLAHIGARAFAYTRLEILTLPPLLSVFDMLLVEGCPLQKLVLPRDSVGTVFLSEEYAPSSFLGFEVEQGNRFFSAVNGGLFGETYNDLYTLDGARLIFFVDREYYVCPPNLREIGDYQFFGRNLTSVKIGKNVTNIGRYAFAGIGENGGGQSGENSGGRLAFVDFSDDAELKTMGRGAFAYQPSLLRVDLSAAVNLQSVPEDCFYACDGLGAVVLPAGGVLARIGQRAFAVSEGGSGKSLTRLDFGSAVGLQRIEDSAFSGRNGLESVILPPAMTYLSGFDGCKNLSSISTNTGQILLQNVGNYAFFGCQSLTEFSHTKALQSIGDFAFAYSGITAFESDKLSVMGDWAFLGAAQLSTVDLSYSPLQEISQSAFEGAIRLSQILLPHGLVTICERAFLGSGLVSVSIPHMAEVIDSAAFAQCLSLTWVEVGSSAQGSQIKLFGSVPFEGCLSLAAIYIFSAVPPSVLIPSGGIANTGSALGRRQIDGLAIFVPYGCVQLYLQAKNSIEYDEQQRQSFGFHTGQIFQIQTVLYSYTLPNCQNSPSNTFFE